MAGGQSLKLQPTKSFWGQMPNFQVKTALAKTVITTNYYN
jgi:hypothetical protein